MAFTQEWILPDKIIYVAFTGELTSQQVSQVDVSLNQALDESTASMVHIVINDSGITAMPSITSLRSLTVASHHKLGWVVIYGNKNKGLRFTTNIATHLLGFKFMFTESYADAMQKLSDNDPSLSPPIDFKPS
ncbi:MAG: hypothetical protein ACLFTK_09595 [Anaerolineales bacterium]